MLTDQCARQVLREIIALYPDVETALDYQNPFELLVAVILSAQTTDVQVNKVTPALFAAYPDPESLSQAKEDDVADYINRIGLYRNKSKYLVACAKMLVEDFDGKVPQNRKDLEKLPGVGRKTANVVLSIAFDIPAFAVDTHVTRVCKHHGIVAQDASVREIEDRVTSLMDPSEWTQAHQALIYFGRNICHPKNPDCRDYPQLYQCLDEKNA